MSKLECSSCSFSGVCLLCSTQTSHLKTLFLQNDGASVGLPKAFISSFSCSSAKEDFFSPSLTFCLALHVRIRCFFYKSKAHYFWIAPVHCALFTVALPLPFHATLLSLQPCTWCFISDLWNYRTMLGVCDLLSSLSNPRVLVNLFLTYIAHLRRVENAHKRFIRDPDWTWCHQHIQSWTQWWGMGTWQVTHKNKTKHQD